MQYITNISKRVQTKKAQENNIVKSVNELVNGDIITIDYKDFIVTENYGQDAFGRKIIVGYWAKYPLQTDQLLELDAWAKFDVKRIDNNISNKESNMGKSAVDNRKFTVDDFDNFEDVDGITEVAENTYGPYDVSIYRENGIYEAYISSGSVWDNNKKDIYQKREIPTLEDAINGLNTFIMYGGLSHIAQSTGKVYQIIRNRRDKDTVHEGTIPELIQYFGYTLEKGKSWEYERGNKKINTNPKTIDALVKALNDSESNAAANGYSGVYYRVGTPGVEASIKSAQAQLFDCRGEVFKIGDQVERVMFDDFDSLYVTNITPDGKVFISSNNSVVYVLADQYDADRFRIFHGDKNASVTKGAALTLEDFEHDTNPYEIEDTYQLEVDNTYLCSIDPVFKVYSVAKLIEGTKYRVVIDSTFRNINEALSAINAYLDSEGVNTNKTAQVEEQKAPWELDDMQIFELEKLTEYEASRVGGKYVVNAIENSRLWHNIRIDTNDYMDYAYEVVYNKLNELGVIYE